MVPVSSTGMAIAKSCRGDACEDACLTQATRLAHRATTHKHEVTSPMFRFTLRPTMLLFLVLVALVASCGRSKLGAPNAPELGALLSPGTQLPPGVPADLAAIKPVQEDNTAKLMTMPDVVGTGLGRSANGEAAILVLTRRPADGLPNKLDGVPVEQVVVGEVKAYGRPNKSLLLCGTSTANRLECATGTIGCVVSSGGNSYYLSNNHVFARENSASIGELVDAPGRYDAKPKCSPSPSCGSLADFEPINFSGNSIMDAAIALVDTSRHYSCSEAGGYAPSSTVVAPSVGLAVKKSGRTSGVTHATIQAINVTIQVQYSARLATFVGQIMMPAAFIRSGDSGALMVTETGNNPVGLCFAGGTGGSFANPIGPVLQRFNATVRSQ